MASSWNVEKTKAADIQSQLGLVRNKTIYMKASAGMTELGYNQNNTLHGYFKSCSIAINLCLLLAIKKLFQLLLCFICNNNNLFGCFPRSSALSPQRVCLWYHAKLPMQQQQAEHEHFKRINLHIIITWDSRRCVHILLSGFVLQNYNVDAIKLDWKCIHQSVFNLDCSADRLLKSRRKNKRNAVRRVP